jgi:hypothetical protein
MRKKLIILVLALAAAAAGTLTPASAKTCPSGTYVFQCANFTVCCPIGALCHC